MESIKKQIESIKSLPFGWNYYKDALPLNSDIADRALWWSDALKHYPVKKTACFINIDGTLDITFVYKKYYYEIRLRAANDCELVHESVNYGTYIHETELKDLDVLRLMSSYMTKSPLIGYKYSKTI